MATEINLGSNINSIIKPTARESWLPKEFYDFTVENQHIYINSLNKDYYDETDYIGKITIPNKIDNMPIQKITSGAFENF